jgi:ubiquinone biosynthesis protein
VLLEVLIAAEDLGRLREITGVLLKYGFDDLVQRMGLMKFLGRAGRLLNLGSGDPMEEVPTERCARLALEELGPTFVKLGQLLASRSDLIGQEWAEEFALLQSKVSTIDWDELRGQVETDLGMPVEEAFARFDRSPLAGGSIGQVHRACLLDGQEVVLKVRRPGIVKKVSADLRLLERMAEVLERELPEFRRFRPVALVRQFGRSIKSELDFGMEARNTSRAAHNLREYSSLHIPTVFEEFTSPRLLVLSLMEGEQADHKIRSGESSGDKGVRLAALGSEVILHMVFVDGFYHADPHPGNVMFLPDGGAALLDFGMVGRLSEARRQQFALLLGCIFDRDTDGLVDILIEWSDGGDTNMELLGQDCADFLDRYTGVELAKLNVAELLQDVTRLVRENNLILPADVAALVRVFLVLDGLGRQLDPCFNLDQHMEPVARKMMREMVSPRRLVARNWREIRRLAVSMPRDMRKLMQRIRRGNFKVELDLQRLDEFGRQLDRSANRITVGLITSALIVGTSIVMTIDVGPHLMGLPILGLLGFGSSFLIGLMLLWSILRSGIR